MKKQYGRNAIILLLSGFCLFLQACSPSPPPRFYELGIAAPPGEIKETSLPILYVAEPFLPHYLDRPQIVTRKSERQLFMDDKNRWAAPLSELMGDHISASLNEKLPTIRVLSGGRAILHPTITMRLEIHILDFTSDPDGTSHLAGTYLLWKDGGREIPFRIKVASGGENLETRIAAMGKALDLLCLEITETVNISMGNE